MDRILVRILEVLDNVRINSNLQPIIIRLDSNVQAPARAVIIRGLIRRLSISCGVFTEVDPPQQHQRPREQARGQYAVAYDALQVWSINTSRQELSDRILRQPSNALSRFPSRRSNEPYLDTGISVENPQDPRGDRAAISSVSRIESF